MMPLFIYILKVILVSGILLGYYWIGLRNTRFHYYNRFYLVATVVFSLILPLLNLQWFTISSSSAKQVQEVVQFIHNPQELTQEQKALGWDQLLSLVLFFVSSILICFFLYGIYKLYIIKAKGKITVMERFDFIETSVDEAPFSFFRNLFWRKDIPLQDETGQRMLKHELTHIEQHHSYDKLFISLATFILWMNPFFWLIRKEMEVVHEFIADEEAVADGDAGGLAEMLLKAHYHSNILSVGQSFFYSSIKRRIIMLTSSRKVSYSYTRRLLILPVAIGVLVLLSFTIKDSFSNESEKQSDENFIGIVKQDTVPAKYRDPKTGKIKGSFQIDIDGDIASFRDIKSKKELFKLPLNELSGPANKVITVQGFPLDMDKKVMFISADSLNPGNSFIGVEEIVSNLSQFPGDASIPRIVINGKVVSPDELDKIDPSSIKSIHIRGNESGVAVAGKNMKGMSWVETTEADGKKVVTVSVDSVYFDGKKYPVSKTTRTISAEPMESNVNIQSIKADTISVKTVKGYKLSSTPKVIAINTTDDNAASVFLNDPKTLTVTVNEADGDKKKTYTIIQKQTEKTDLPKDLLYVIDGTEMESGSMKDVDPNTIKMVNVLKGDAAIKKYGDKAKNGVVEITTKK